MTKKKPPTNADELRERLRETLEEACAALPERCLQIRTHSYKNGTVDAEIRIAAPSTKKLREFMVTIEQPFQDLRWPRNSWFSLMFMGSYSPSRYKDGTGMRDMYARRLGMDLIEMHSRGRHRLGTMFIDGREILGNLYRRQKTNEIAVRIFVGPNQPKRRFSK